MKKIILTCVYLITFHSMSLLNAQRPVYNHSAIFVKDLGKSAAFYKDVIGLDPIPDPFKDDKHAWFSIGPDVELHIIAGAKRIKKHHQDNHICFSVPSIDSFIPRLIKSNITYINARGKKNVVTIRPDGVKQIYLKDPDGYWIEINDAKK